MPSIIRSNIFSAIIFTSLLCMGFLSSCNKDVFSSDPSHSLSFSVDTLSFDTVFTTIGSATKRVMVYNNNNKALRISNIGLKENTSSVFKINVDGHNSPNNRFSNIEISAKDSMYIFVSVKVDELGINLPFFIEDELFFQLNGKTQNVVLETYGQDVIFLKGVVFEEDATLTGEKPYVIHDSLIVALEKTLTLEAGCRLYFHQNAALRVSGNLIAEGTREKPIVMRGDRFDNINFDKPVPYNTVAGQWDGIYLTGDNTKHSLKHVHINSGYVGIYIRNSEEETIPAPENMPEIEIVNCRIHNSLFYGLAIENANVTVVNSEISNSGSYLVYMNGGTHTFVHTTIANYFNKGESSAQSKFRNSGEPSFMIMGLDKTAPMKTTFLNSVITGSFDNELTIATRFPELYDGIFKNSYIRKKEPLETPQFDESIQWYKKDDIVFTSIEFDMEKDKYYNFTPDSVSPLRNLGDPQTLDLPEYSKYDLRYDMNGNDRKENEKPDAGAYQWVPKKED
ncbi:right-handed parallel beta-helix repeat-containing protein [Paludibacter sp. 221]|uniref:right-handed parallel beta-helix repeat-containing protein n=1 Tax=Paludibacter sp. 221 TaxID=2302939 RepID=UPI0013D05A19|nr:right-handed parallel beta-helix repeat-containing protein [Paludibacter sp. 221]NDV47106.1 right-handed parallel beta-helix repeat-containing protein [Paludibacter sp. 221]